MPTKKLIVSSNSFNGTKPIFEIRPVLAKEDWMNTHTMNPILIQENSLANQKDFLFNTV